MGAALLCLLLAGCQQGAGCDLVKAAQVPLEPMNPLFAVPMTIGGHKLKILLDTGAQKSLLDEGTVRRLQIPQDGRTVTIIVGVAGGAPKFDANVDGMLLGDAPLSVDRMPVSTTGIPGIDGVLGLDSLRDYDLDIDGPNRTLTLYRVRWCDRADPPWNEAAAPIDGIGTRMGWMQVPFEIDGVAGTALVDTGASLTTIAPRMARRLGLTDQAMANDRILKLHVAASEDIQARVHRFETIRIGPMTLRDANIVVLSKDPPQVGDSRSFGDGAIGQDFLGGRHMWFSIRTGRLYLSSNAATPGH